MSEILLCAACALCIGYIGWILSDSRCMAWARSLYKKVRLFGDIHVHPYSANLSETLTTTQAGRFFAKASSKKRKEALKAVCLQELPELIDVIALGLSAGISFDAALALYCSKYKTLLSQKLDSCRLSWELGLEGRKEALNRLAQELDCDAFTTFVATVTESLEFGAPLSQVLSGQAQAVREAHRYSVEERIEKAPVKMIIPTAVLVLPALLLAIMGPLMASMVHIVG